MTDCAECTPSGAALGGPPTEAGPNTAVVSFPSSADFADASRRADLLRREMRMQGGSGAAAYELAAARVRSLLPVMERLGMAASSEVELETLAARLESEVCDRGGVVKPPPMIGAWARKPG